MASTDEPQGPSLFVMWNVATEKMIPVVRDTEEELLADLAEMDLPEGTYQVQAIWPPKGVTTEEFKRELLAKLLH